MAGGNVVGGRHHEPACVLILSPLAFALVWWLFLALHLCCAYYQARIVQLHVYLQLPTVYALLDYLATDLYRFFPVIIPVNALLAASHAFAFLGTVGFSLYHRELVFHFSTKKLTATTPPQTLQVQPSSEITCSVGGRRNAHDAEPGARATSTKCRPAWSRTVVHHKSMSVYYDQVLVALRAQPQNQQPKKRRLFCRYPRVAVVWPLLTYAFQQLFGRRGIFGMESRYFGRVFFARESLEIVFQTYQTWKLSALVSTVWINRSMVLLIVANCWSTPIVHRLFHRPGDAPWRKVFCLGLDLLLDFTSSVIVPLAIVYQYVQAYDAHYGDFPLLAYYDDTWFIRAVAENQQFFVMSTLDLVTKVLPAISVLSTARAIKATFRRRRPTTTPTSEVVPTVVMPDTNMTAVPTRPPQRRWHNVSRLADTLLVLWGLAVFVIHVQVTIVAWSNDAARTCLLEMRPWFSTQYNCIVTEINCEVMGLNKDATSGHVGAQLDALLSPLEAVNVRELILSSCRALELPRRLQTFPQLKVLKIYNVTIASWPIEAALVDGLHPNLQFLYMIDTNFSTNALPPGLLGRDFPHALQDIEFCGTNLTSLPDDLDEVWGIDGYLDYFVLENVHGGLPEIPPVLAHGRLRMRHLSLCANNLTTVPEWFFAENSTVELLDLSSNPLTVLPEREELSEATSSSEFTPLWELHLEYTELRTLPKWLSTTESVDPSWGRRQLLIYATGTRLCDHVNPGEGLNLSTVVTIDCSGPSDPTTIRLLYPIDAERQWRRESAKRSTT